MLAIYGGSFDPPHLGHSQILKFLAESPEISKVLVIPTFQNPLKKNFNGFSKELRSQIIEAWQKDLSTWLDETAFQKIEFSLIEFENPNPSYTIETVQTLKQKFPDLPLVLALGEDNFATLLKWKTPKVLLESLHSVWIFPRHNSQIQVSQVPTELRPCCPIRWTAYEVVSVSSTQIRKLLESGNEVPKDLMSPMVRELILKSQVS